MQFNTINFFIFFPICFILYYQFPLKKSKWPLLIFSLFFYSCFSYGAVFVLILVAIISWLGEMIVIRNRNKTMLFLFLALTLLPLILLKYLDAVPGFILPIGISFFTLQAVSGIVDTYKHKQSLTDFGDHLLYLSFFPTVVSGPITRKKDFLEEIHRPKIFSYEMVRIGFYRIAIGYIEKFFLADQIGRLVNYVYNHSTEVTGIQILISTILYFLQLYYDFAGYSHMAIGFAKCFGITITENFERPLLATSIKDFWRRWHKSLSSWLKDYLYIPLGGSRNGNFRKYTNLIVTFLVSGLWHGVGLNFLFWGFLQGVYQIIEDKLSPKTDNFISKDKKFNTIIRIFRTVVVFLLIDFSFIFFRATDMTTAIQMLKKVFFEFQISSLFTTWWFDYGMCKLEYIMWCIIAIVIFVFDIMEEKNNSLLLKLEQQKIWVRWSVYTCAISIIIIALIINWGRNTSSFLYQNF